MAATPAKDVSPEESLPASNLLDVDRFEGPWSDLLDIDRFEGPWSDLLEEHFMRLVFLRGWLRESSALELPDIRRATIKSLLHRRLDARRRHVDNRPEPLDRCALCGDLDLVDAVWVDPNLYIVNLPSHQRGDLDAFPAQRITTAHDAVTSDHPDYYPRPLWLLNAFWAGYEHGLRHSTSSQLRVHEPVASGSQDVYGLYGHVLYGHVRESLDFHAPSAPPKTSYVLSAPLSNKSKLPWLEVRFSQMLGSIEDDLASGLLSRLGSLRRGVKTSESTATGEDDPVATAPEHPHEPVALVLRRFADAFGRALAEFLETDDDLVAALAEQSPEDLAEQAAEQIVAPFLWARAVGDKFDTTQVTQILGISRQAVAKRVAGGSLLGIPGRGTTYFPAWQFDLERRAIKLEVALMIEAFRESIEPLDPLTMASWATTEQSEDLDGSTPEEWILDGRDPQQLIEAARRAAKRLSQ